MLLIVLLDHSSAQSKKKVPTERPVYLLAKLAHKLPLLLLLSSLELLLTPKHCPLPPAAVAAVVGCMSCCCYCCSVITAVGPSLSSANMPVEMEEDGCTKSNRPYTNADIS
jgi:hypothetical protein